MYALSCAFFVLSTYSTTVMYAHLHSAYSGDSGILICDNHVPTCVYIPLSLCSLTVYNSCTLTYIPLTLNLAECNSAKLKYTLLWAFPSPSTYSILYMTVTYTLSYILFLLGWPLFMSGSTDLSYILFHHSHTPFSLINRDILWMALSIFGRGDSPILVWQSHTHSSTYSFYTLFALLNRDILRRISRFEWHSLQNFTISVKYFEECHDLSDIFRRISQFAWHFSKNVTIRVTFFEEFHDLSEFFVYMYTPFLRPCTLSSLFHLDILWMSRFAVSHTNRNFLSPSCTDFFYILTHFLYFSNSTFFELRSLHCDIRTDQQFIFSHVHTLFVFWHTFFNLKSWHFLNVTLYTHYSRILKYTVTKHFMNFDTLFPLFYRKMFEFHFYIVIHEPESYFFFLCTHSLYVPTHVFHPWTVTFFDCHSLQCDTSVTHELESFFFHEHTLSLCSHTLFPLLNLDILGILLTISIIVRQSITQSCTHSCYILTPLICPYIVTLNRDIFWMSLYAFSHNV